MLIRLTTYLSKVALSHCSCNGNPFRLTNMQVNVYLSKSYSDASDTSKLSKYSYWKETYARRSETNTSFDWFLDANDLREQLATELNDLKGIHSQLNVLDLGCGNSSLPSNMYRGIQSPIFLFCADFILDALLIQKNWLSATSPGHSQSIASFVTCNACNIPFRDNTFHMVIDKGTMDALLKNVTVGERRAASMVSEVYRILCSGGKYIQITDEDPDVRLPLLENLSRKLQCSFTWSFTTIENNSNKEYFIFQFTKPT